MCLTGVVQASERTPSASVTPDLFCKQGQQVLCAGQRSRGEEVNLSAAENSDAAKKEDELSCEAAT